MTIAMLGARARRIGLSVIFGFGLSQISTNAAFGCDLLGKEGYPTMGSKAKKTFGEAFAEAWNSVRRERLEEAQRLLVEYDPGMGEQARSLAVRLASQRGLRFDEEREWREFIVLMEKATEAAATVQHEFDSELRVLRDARIREEYEKRGIQLEPIEERMRAGLAAFPGSQTEFNNRVMDFVYGDEMTAVVKQRVAQYTKRQPNMDDEPYDDLLSARAPFILSKLYRIFVQLFYRPGAHQAINMANMRDVLEIAVRLDPRFYRAG